MPQDKKAASACKIATINIENIKTNLPFLHQLMDRVDVLCVQEHWLYHFEAPNVGQFVQGLHHQIKCCDDNNPICPDMKPRGKGGVLTLWKDHMDHLITPLPDGSSRTMVTQIGTDCPIFIINSYMPTNGSEDSYQEALDEVIELMNKFRERGKVIWLGDLNASKHRHTSPNDKHFTQVCHELNLDTTDLKDQEPTYHHFIGNIKSRIDHILAPPEAIHCLADTWTEGRDPLNMSSHDPVFTKILTEPETSSCDDRAPNEEANRKINWRKTDTHDYHAKTKRRLESLIQHGGLALPSETLVDRLYDILLKTGVECSPAPKIGRKRSNKYPWAPELKPFIKTIKHLFFQWKKQGRDPDDPTLLRLNESKKSFRSYQRQLAAEHRNTMLREISEASTDDRSLFYKLVQRQRGSRTAIRNNVDFGDCNNQHEGWAKYYEKLATSESLPHFDEEHATAMKHKLHLVSLQNRIENDPEPVSVDQISEHLRALKNNKAADVFGLTAEHLKFAAPELATVLTALTNNILKESKLPDQFKVGALVPTHKKGKPLKEPDSYRRITISSNLGKIVEKEIMNRTKPIAAAKQDQLQYGFTEGCSPSLCALIITEAVAEAKDKKSPLFLSFLDSSKAFDMVDHTCLLNALYDTGIKGHIWYIYQDMYAKVSSKVRLNGQLSRIINESRGIRQGGETSTEAFKAKDNAFLSRVRNHPTAFRIGSTSVGIPTVADDNCMMSDTHMGAQIQLHIAQNNAEKCRYVFSTKKSKVMLVNGNQGEKMNLDFNGATIEFSSSETHLGLIRTDSGGAREAVRERIQIGRRTANALMGAGLYGVNGISPHISKTLISIYVNPAMLYGLEALCLEESDYIELDRAHRTLLRQIQGLPDSTAVPAIYLLLGVMPIRAVIHQKILNLFMSILHRKESPECDIVIRQLTMKDTNSHSWTIKLRQILCKYELPVALQLVEHSPTKVDWKCTVKKAISSYWGKTLREEAANKSSLKNLNLVTCCIGQSHPVWMCGTDPLQAIMANTKAVMLVGRYPVTGQRCAGKHMLPVCPLCSTEQETLTHFLVRCPILQGHREPFLVKLKMLMPDHFSQASDDDLAQQILDPSHLTSDEALLGDVEDITRRMCFKLHNHRAIALGIGSMNSKALRRIRGGKGCRVANKRNKPPT